MIPSRVSLGANEALRQSGLGYLCVSRATLPSEALEIDSLLASSSFWKPKHSSFGTAGLPSLPVSTRPSPLCNYVSLCSYLL